MIFGFHLKKELHRMDLGYLIYQLIPIHRICHRVLYFSSYHYITLKVYITHVRDEHKRVY